MVSAANSAKKQGIRDEVKNANQRIAEGFRKTSSGTILGGDPTGAQVSEQGTILTNAQQKKSLLGQE